MANCAQATLRGSEMVVECDDRWDCCQRAQAAAKVRRMNERIQQSPSSSAPRVRAPGFSRGKGDDWCKSNAKQMDKLSPQGQAQLARDAGAPECLAKKLEGDATTNPPVPPQSRKDLGLALDHPLDMKFGGPAMPQRLLPLDPKVNGAFGSFARVIGDQVGAGNKLEKVSLICPPSQTGCPGEDHSTKNDQGQPPNPIGMFETTTTYTFT